jgi:ABC-type branched-subunit amino acid transport system ATPase component
MVVQVTALRYISRFGQRAIEIRAVEDVSSNRTCDEVYKQFNQAVDKAAEKRSKSEDEIYRWFPDLKRRHIAKAAWLNGGDATEIISITNDYVIHNPMLELEDIIRDQGAGR